MTDGAPSSQPERTIRIPTGRASGEVRERGSKFLAIVAPARDADEAVAVRDEVRARHHDATHHVWAFRSADGEERWDDDGEPAGTGGRPILAAIRSARISDVVVVVTRWFGGTKLGTGGLVRSYGAAAAAAIGDLPVKSVVAGRVVTIRHPWSDTGAVATVLDAGGARRREERHGATAEFDVVVPEDRVAALADSIRDATAGRAETRIGEGRVWLQVKG